MPAAAASVTATRKNRRARSYFSGSIFSAGDYDDDDGLCDKHKRRLSKSIRWRWS